MTLKGIINEDYINYKKISMTLIFPRCNNFKCGTEYCQNSSLTKEKDIELEISDVVTRYLNNPITESVVMQGLEPFDSWDNLLGFVDCLRKLSDDDIVIYTGYNKEEIVDKVFVLSNYKNIIIKFGRYIPDQAKHYDAILCAYLASDNQYAEKIS